MCYNKAAVYNRNASGFLTTRVSKALQRCLKGNNLKPSAFLPTSLPTSKGVLLPPFLSLLRGGQRAGEETTMGTH